MVTAFYMSTECDVSQLYAIYEEANTNMILHAENAAHRGCQQIVIRSHSDVQVSRLFTMHLVCFDEV